MILISADTLRKLRYTKVLQNLANLQLPFTVMKNLFSLLEQIEVLQNHKDIEKLSGALRIKADPINQFDLIDSRMSAVEYLLIKDLLLPSDSPKPSESLNSESASPKPHEHEPSS